MGTSDQEGVSNKGENGWQSCENLPLGNRVFTRGWRGRSSSAPKRGSPICPTQGVKVPSGCTWEDHRGAREASQASQGWVMCVIQVSFPLTGTCAPCVGLTCPGAFIHKCVSTSCPSVKQSCHRHRLRLKSECCLLKQSPSLLQGSLRCKNRATRASHVCMQGPLLSLMIPRAQGMVLIPLLSSPTQQPSGYKADVIVLF